MWYILGGAGALGGLWAVRRHLAGLPTTLILRQPGSLKTLWLKDDQGTHEANIPVLSGTAQIEKLIVATKAHQTLAALLPLMEHIAPHAQIILLQNGMGVAEQLEEHRADLRLFHAVSTDGAYKTSPDHIVHAGQGTTWVGARNPDTSLDTTLKELLAPGLHLQQEANIQNRLWQKLAINCAINALTVIHDCCNGELLNIPDALATMEACCQETAAVMTALSIATDGSELFSQARSVAASTAQNTSSMLADVRAGRETEIRFINGYVSGKAKVLGLSTPTHEKLIQAVLERSISRQ